MTEEYAAAPSVVHPGAAGWTAVAASGPMAIRPSLWFWVRVVALGVWTGLLAHQITAHGVPFDREGQLLWIVCGLVAATIGTRAPWTVIIDWLPFAAVLVAYDFARGAADSLGMPTWWSPQIIVDRALFGGIEPTVWLQEHLKSADARWWDVATTLVYLSFFFLPYVTAGALWLRSRREFHRWAARFVTLSLLGFGLFALLPAAPPWAAARCTAAQVAHHPSQPYCMRVDPSLVRDGGLLGPVTHPRGGAHPWIERMSGRGWPELHLHVAQSVLDKGQAVVDQVAAVPSLHAGGTLLFVLFLWRRVARWIRGPLIAYAVAMAFALVYTAEHYVADILAGWLLAVVVTVGFDRLERRRSRSAPPDTLDAHPPTASRMENPCPPTATIPSST